MRFDSLQHFKVIHADVDLGIIRNEESQKAFLKVIVFNH